MLICIFDNNILKIFRTFSDNAHNFTLFVTNSSESKLNFNGGRG